MSEDIATVAYDARNKANAAHDKMEAHERLCAERYLNINNSITDLKTIIKWTCTLMISLIIGALGWSLTQQVDTVNQQMHDLQAAKPTAAYRLEPRKNSR